ncbi:MAG: hydantoinase [SAR86 cluster bacterium]|uniref:Hydantoinase n=1 Tax=SAR86 cluster bacterium TaxID=2030880 RepID=A0A2A5CJ63_9GAMM|nr:hydantoinase/oxoprolinase family protein [Gammaproteobacteria bacterium AH-315-E17]PCJ43490.1 MAG: hydantoinase [SAR86 cluster bacterium]
MKQPLTLASTLGIDTGGTFTDFVLIQQGKLHTHKVLSTPDAPERAILQGITELGLAESVSAGEVAIIHGSTIATNAALEGKGVRTAFVTNRGFKDMLTIARQTRPKLYQLETPPRPPPVPKELCLEISGRFDASGQELERPSATDLQALINQLEELRPDAIAINLLFSFLNDEHEKLIEQTLLAKLSWQPFICRSSIVLPEYKEYERGIATWLNASLGPLVKNYLLKLKADTSPSPLSIMQSSGGTINAEQAASKAVNLLLSGPAGGLAAASYLSKQLNIPDLMTFDMGGTSTDAALLDDGNIQLSSEGSIGSYPVGVPMVDMQTIGAGGGSIAYLDAGSLLHVGPESAGAKPGPACYGLGGTDATVTDANLLLGRLQAESFMAGGIRLDYAAAEKAINKIVLKLALTIEEVAEGIVNIANSHMAQALRAISVEKGYDPKQFRLCCFGGAGGLHICALAEALGMDQALIPRHAGVLSALGMLLAPVKRNFSCSYQYLLTDAGENAITQAFATMETQALKELSLEQINSNNVLTEYSVDMRYSGQSSSLNLSWKGLKAAASTFHDLHKSRYGHQLQAEPELVNLRLSVQAQQQEYKLERLNQKISQKKPAQATKQISLYGFKNKVKIYERDSLIAQQIITGPALILERNSTTLIGTEWRARTDQFGHLFLDKQRAWAEDNA